MRPGFVIAALVAVLAFVPAVQARVASSPHTRQQVCTAPGGGSLPKIGRAHV